MEPLACPAGVSLVPAGNSVILWEWFTGNEISTMGERAIGIIPLVLLTDIVVNKWRN